MFEEGDDDQDSIKQALLETNPILLGGHIFIHVPFPVLTRVPEVGYN